MNKDKHIQERVNQTLNSLEGLERATANPYLFTRIKARLEEKKESWTGLVRLLSRPAFAIGLVATVIILNILIVSKSTQPAEEPTDQIVALAQDYNFQPSNILENGFNQP